MSGGGTTRTVVQQQPSGNAPQVLPELAPYVSQVGRNALGALNMPQLSVGRFAQDQQLQVPNLSPLEQAASSQIGNRITGGIPTPVQEQISTGYLSGLPFAAGSQVDQNPQTQQSLGTLGLGAGVGLNAPPATQEAMRSLGQFSGGDVGQSPAIQSALQGLQDQIVPAVQNQAALSGLGQSGFLPQQIGRSYAQQLVPLYSQGMQQQLQAGTQLGNIGIGQQAMGMQGLQGLAQGQYNVGTNEQQLATDARNRWMQSVLGSAQPMQQLGNASTQRGIEALNEATQMGQTQRNVELSKSQAALDSYMRQRELAMGYNNPFGSYPTSTVPPTMQTRQTQTSPGSFGVSK